MKTQKTDKTRVISLDDLAPRTDVTGGSGVRVFGHDAVSNARQAPPERRAGSQNPTSRKKS